METVEDPWSRGKVSDQQEVFKQGLLHWQNDELDAALNCFRAADQQANRNDVYRNLYTSYHGVALVFKGDISGLNFCRQAASVERNHADVFCNLAMAEHRLNHRRRACAALDKGLKLDARHVGILRLRAQMGMRRPPLLGFLSRDNLLNRLLGRLFYRGRKRG